MKGKIIKLLGTSCYCNFLYDIIYDMIVAKKMSFFITIRIYKQCDSIKKHLEQNVK